MATYKFFLLIMLYTTHSYVITTNVDNYIKKCSTEYVEEISYAITPVFDKIKSIIETHYTEPIIDKLNLKEIIIVKSDKFNGLFCSPGTIVLSIKNNNFDETTLHHEIMNMIDYSSTNSYGEEWDRFNKFGYAKDNSHTLMKGFISWHSMKNRKLDIATMFEEFMCTTYSKGATPVLYDNIVINKFKLLFRKLIDYHADFDKIIKKRNIEKNYIFPDVDSKNVINIKFKSTNCGPASNYYHCTQHGFILYNIKQIYNNANQHLLSECMKQWFSENANHDSAEITDHVGNINTCIQQNNYVTNIRTGYLLNIFRNLDTCHKDYTIRYMPAEKKESDYYEGLITIKY